MDFLTVKQAATTLNLSAATLNKWRCTGGGPTFIKYSASCIRYRLADLVAWAEARAFAHTSEPGYATA